MSGSAKETHCADLVISSVPSLDLVSASEWDRLATSRGFYVSHGWLRAVEENPSARAEYLLASRSGKLVGALPLYHVFREGTPFYAQGRLQPLLHLDGTYLVGGARRAYRNDLLIAPSEPDAASALVETALARASELEFDGVAWFYLTTAAASLLAEVAPLSYTLDTAEAELVVRPGGLDAYVAGLHPHRRRAVRREIARFDQAGWHVGEEALGGCVDELAVLLAKVERKYEHAANEVVLGRILGDQERHIGNASIVFTCRESDGSLVGAALMYRWRDTLYGRLVGLDYERLRDAYEYFNLVYYLPIAYMARHSLTRLHLGIESLDAKLFRGGVAHPLWTGITRTDARISNVGQRRADQLEEWLGRNKTFPHAFDANDWRLPAPR